MAKKKTESTKGEAVKQKDTPPDNAVQGKKSFFTAKKVETVVAVLLGVTTLLSAWASWIGSLHSGIQSINFTKSNNMASQGTSEYNMGMQLYLILFIIDITYPHPDNYTTPVGKNTQCIEYGQFHIKGNHFTR